MPGKPFWLNAVQVVKQQQKPLMVFSLGAVLTLVALIYCYPYLILSLDSGSYVSSAEKEVIGYRPYGYSVFIRLIHSMNTSMRSISLIQYLIYSLSFFLFALSILHFWKLKAHWINILWGLAVFLCPSALYLAFSLMSDSLFTSLTILYLTSILWMIYRPGSVIFVLHLLILWCLLYTRFTSVAYVPVSMMAIYFTVSNKWIGLLKGGLIVLVFFAYYQGTRNQYARDTSVYTFSPFAGWQMLNNALHIYPEIRPRAADFSDPQTKTLITFLNQYPDTFYAHDGSYYIWNNSSPLKQYLQVTLTEKKWTYFKTWVYLGDIYNKAGKQIILHYPLAYLKSFLLPVIKSMIFPSSGFCYTENLSKDKPLSDYFKLPNETQFLPRQNIFRPLASWVPWTAAFFWMITGLSAAWLFLKRKLLGKRERLVFSCFVVFLLSYSVINLLSGVIEIRYLTPVHSVQLLMVLGGLLTLPNIKAKIQK